MNSFKLNPNQTLYYTYHPESDKLAIRLRPELGKITSTTLPDMPHVQVSRDIRSHAVVGLNISGVQQLILQQFIKSVFEQLEPYLEEADASEKRPTADPTIPKRQSETQANSSISPKTTEFVTTEAQESGDAQGEAQEARETAEASDAPREAQEPQEAQETAEASDAQAEAQEAQEGSDAEVEEAQETAEASDAQAEAQEAQEGSDAEVEEAQETAEASDAQAEAQEAQEAPEASDAQAEAQEAQEAPEASDAQAEAQETQEAQESSDAQAEAQETREAAEASDAQAEAQEASSDGFSRSDSPSTTEVVTTMDSEAQEAQEAQEASHDDPSAQLGPDFSRSDFPSTTEVVTTIDSEAQEASDAEEETQKAQEANEEVKEESQQDHKPKRPRRRRRKKKSSERAKAAQSGTESEVVQAETASSEDKSLTADQTDSSQPRKRRRKRRKKKSETSAALTKDTQNEEASEEALPTTVEREIVPTLSWEERIKNDPRRSYKTNPIPGLGAPEGFAFMEMDDLIGQALYALGFLEPTPIQAKAIPPALEGRDIIGLAQTGTGKTLSFIIPILQNLLTNESQEHIPRALIMTPTRELAVQIAEDAEFAGTHTDLLITTIYGGVGFKQQVNELQEGTDIIVATPGRLLDHMKQRTLNLDDIAILVLDEADRMLDMGFLPEIRRIMRQLPNDYQSLLFSATMPSAIERLSSDFQHQPQVIEIARQLPPETISQYLYPVEKHLKVPLLVHLLQETEEMNSVLIFTETKSEAEVVARRLERANLTVALMHGDRKQREREKALQNLRTGAVRILVATNVAARGLDINDISHVINYDMPQSVDDYIHRIGRTARGDATGQAYTFVTIADEGMVSRIESALKRELPREWAEDFNYDVPTPSWARPSVDQIIESLHKTEGLAERFNRMIRRR